VADTRGLPVAVCTHWY